MAPEPRVCAFSLAARLLKTNPQLILLYVGESWNGPCSRHKSLAEQPINCDLQQFGKHQLPRVWIPPPMLAQISALVRNGDKVQPCALGQQPPAAHTYSLQMKSAADDRCRSNGTMFSKPI